MNENEQKELERLAHNPTMLRALRKLFLNKSVTEFNLSQSNERLGEIIRAAETANKAVEEVFKELYKITKKDEAKDKGKNPAR